MLATRPVVLEFGLYSLRPTLLHLNSSIAMARGFGTYPNHCISPPAGWDLLDERILRNKPAHRFAHMIDGNHEATRNVLRRLFSYFLGRFAVHQRHFTLLRGKAY